MRPGTLLGSILGLSLVTACGGRAGDSDLSQSEGSGSEGAETGDEAGTGGGEEPFCLDSSLAAPPQGCTPQCGNGVVDVAKYDGCSEQCDTGTSTCEALGYPNSGEVPCLDTCLWDEQACDSCASGGNIARCLTSELPAFTGFIPRLEIATRGDELGVLMTAWQDDTGGMLFARVNKELEVISVTPCVDIGYGNVDLATLEDGWLASQSAWVDGSGRFTRLHKFDLEGQYVALLDEFSSPANWPRFLLDDDGPLMVSDGDLLDDIEPIARKYSTTGELLWELELDFDPEQPDGSGPWDAVNDGDGMVLLDQKGNNALEPLRLIRLTDAGEVDWVKELPFPEGPRNFSLSRTESGFEVFFTNYDTGAPMVMVTDTQGELMSTFPLALGYEFSSVETLETSGRTLLLSTNYDPGELRLTRYPDGTSEVYNLATGPSGFAAPMQHARGETGTFLAWEENAWPNPIKMAFVNEL